MDVEGKFEIAFDLNASKMDPALVKKFREIAPEIVGEEHVKEITEWTPAGEDFARFTKLVPSLYIYHCSRFADKPNYPHHNPKFDVDEAQFWSGTAYFTQFAFDWQEKT